MEIYANLFRHWQQDFPGVEHLPFQPAVVRNSVLSGSVCFELPADESVPFSAPASQADEATGAVFRAPSGTYPEHAQGAGTGCVHNSGRLGVPPGRPSQCGGIRAGRPLMGRQPPLPRAVWSCTLPQAWFGTVNFLLSELEFRRNCHARGRLVLAPFSRVPQVTAGRSLMGRCEPSRGWEAVQSPLLNLPRASGGRRRRWIFVYPAGAPASGAGLWRR